jgi:hypothetical protein
MRPALLLALLALPVAGVAQAPAASGQLLEIDNFDAFAGRSYVNAAQCAGTEPLRLEWNIVSTNGPFTGGGTYRIYAANRLVEGSDFCPEEDGGAAVSPRVSAGLVDTAVVVSAIQRKLDVPGNLAVQRTGFSCDTDEGAEIRICSHWYDQASVRRGLARGIFLVQLAAPASPTLDSVGPGDGRLRVSWTPGALGTVAADTYVAQATPVDEEGTPIEGAVTMFSPRTNATTTRISGLTNGTLYRVTVTAFSVGRNPSAESNALLETPVPVADFWDVYEEADGREQGGCASGRASPVALLAAAAILLALRRRR